MIHPFRDHVPDSSRASLIAPGAHVIGDVTLGEHASVWFGAVLRGDVCHIRVGAETSIQDNAVIHVSSAGIPTIVGDRVTVGHSAILHACTVESDVIIGMGAKVLDGAKVGSFSIVGAGALIPPGKQIPSGVLCVGSPARVKRELTEKELAWIRKSAEQYVQLSQSYATESG